MNVLSSCVHRDFSFVIVFHYLDVIDSLKFKKYFIFAELYLNRSFEIDLFYFPSMNSCL